MASTNEPGNANPTAADMRHPAHAAPSDHTDAAAEAAEIHHRGPERGPEQPQTRSEYIETVLAQIKGEAK
jgi:hypothetical protein